MSVGAIQDQKTTVSEMFIQEALRESADVSARAHQRDAISGVKHKGNHSHEAPSENVAHDAVDVALLPTGIDVTKLMVVLRQLEVATKRNAPRIAFKTKGRIFFVEVNEIVAVQAEGNYVSLRHRANSYLLRESISTLAEKLKPYGFIRIHRSVVVNTAAVEQLEPLPTGEYRLRVKGGMEYMVTRTYKDNLRELAQLWVGRERLCGS